MNILFINISKQWESRTYREYPYGIGILATIVQNAGYNVQIYDMAVDERSVDEVMEAFNPQIICISFLSPSLSYAKEIIKLIRKNFSGCLISGGIHSTLYPENVINLGADVVICGEGEPIILDVIESYRSENVFDSLLKVPNIYFRNKHNEIVKTHCIKTEVSLDKLPIIDRNLYDLRLYSHHTILTSRCCPYKCRFCCSWAPGGITGRTMSSERIIRELEYLVENFGEIELYWGDEIFFFNKKERLDFCRTLKNKNLPIKFTVQLRADLIDNELVQALIEAGCEKICIGAESGSDKLLRAANKKVTAKQIETAISTCVELGLKCKTWWMVGLPGGDYDEQLKSIDVIKNSMPNEVAIHQFVPLPGSEFWNDAEKYGISRPHEEMFEELNYYSDPTKIHIYDYISESDLYDILKIYEAELTALGYVSTDKATKDSKYVYTTPFQKTTFHI